MTDVQMDRALTDDIVDKAIRDCADRKFSGDAREALVALQQGRCDLCAYFSESLISQVSQILGEMDETVRAIYKVEPEFASLCPEASVRASGGRRTGINLIAWVDRKSAALSSLSSTLEAALAESRRKIGCPHASPACRTLGVQMIDDRDVEEWRGYAVLANSMYAHSTLVWARDGEPSPELQARRIEPSLRPPFDPELAPEELLFNEARSIEAMPEAERAAFDHHLRELKVVLIRRMVSDQLAYINLAKDWLSFEDLAEVQRRRIGQGKIGGKAAGLILAARVLNEAADEDVRQAIRSPESYYLASDLMYVFMAMNGLMHWNDQKYRSEDRIRDDYSQIVEEFRSGGFPPEILFELRAVLREIGPFPVIVRSSSQLEDSLGTSFAGKYDSHFCPNAGTPEQNLSDLTRAIALTYASTFRPDALLYRRAKGLQDYDERMAVLLQVVQGERWGRYFLPFGAGVGFSRNLYRWAPHIRREDGFARLVWGLGTRAVDRVGNDYPRLVALSHPTLLPDDSAQAIHYYSQHYVDLIDLRANCVRTLPIEEVLAPDYPALNLLVQREEDGYYVTPRYRIGPGEVPRLAVNFAGLLTRTRFPAVLMDLLNVLEEHWHSPVDVEFTLHPAESPADDRRPPPVQISLLQCRPLPRLQAAYDVRWPSNLAPEDLILASSFLVPQGYLTGIRSVVFVVPEKYFALPPSARGEIGRSIARLNGALPPKSFICVGPGRWGTENSDLGVYVGYADICHAAALVELSGDQIGPAPEPSFGTHFFHDLTEAQIYSVSLRLDVEGSVLNREFFYGTESSLSEWISPSDPVASALRLIEVAAVRPGHHLDIIMDDERGETLGYLAPDP